MTEYRKMKHDPANINAEDLPRKNKRFSNKAKIGYTIELILSGFVAVGGFMSTIMTIVALHTPFWWITMLAAICTVIGLWVFIDTVKEMIK